MYRRHTFIPKTLRLRLVAFVILAIFFKFSSQPFAAKEVPKSRNQIQLSFAPLVQQTGPAVVNIFAKTEKIERNISPLFGDPFFRRFFGDLFPTQPQKRTQQSLGSGVLIDPSGLIVTNNHVIANATKVKVVLADRREFDAIILLADKRTDLAVLKVSSASGNLPFIEMRDSDSVQVGDLVLAIGNPFGVGQTVTSGIVSALARTAVGITDYSFFIQTDASINPGNSGGALISMDGRLIGINTAIFSNHSAGGGSVGIGFAVPANMVRTVVQSVQKGKVIRPWLGASGQNIDSDLANEFGLSRPAGVILNEIYPESPAEEAGLTTGDIILAIDKKLIDDTDTLRYRVATLPLGQKVPIEILREGHVRILNFYTREPLSQPLPEITEIKGRNPLNGAKVANLSPAFAFENGLDDMKQGVVIISRRRGSVAERFGFRRGDIVLKINSRSIDSVMTIKKAIARNHSLWRISILRDDKVLMTEISDK
ncbi:MAG: serine protease [Rhodospirillaceae bacterium]|nr:serine protease [Rhodospirillaceae bacterium]